MKLTSFLIRFAAMLILSAPGSLLPHDGNAASPPLPNDKSAGQSLAAQVTVAKGLIDDWHGDRGPLLRAQQILVDLTKRDPGYAPAFVQLARVTFKLGYISGDNYEKRGLESAQEYVSKALKLDPTLGDAYVTYAYVLYFQRRLDAAREKAAQASRLPANATDLLILQAFLANAENKSDEAIALANKVLVSTEDKFSLHHAHRELGRAYTQKKAYEQVEASYEARLKLYPQRAWDHASYSKFLSWRGKHEAAVQHGETALKLMDFGAGHGALAYAYQSKGDHLLFTVGDARQAQQYYHLAIEHNPELPEAHYGAGMACRANAAFSANSSMIEQCRISIEKSLKLNPSIPYAKIVLDTLPDFQTAINMPGRTADEHLKRGLLYLKATGYEEGMKDLYQAHEMEPTRIDIYKQIDNVLSGRREWDAVISMWTKLITLQPKNGQAYYERGGASFHKGDMPNALKDLEQACKYNYGDSCQRLQRFAKQ
jgi:tetratricopeptide (TPR) repeat protein